VTSWEFDATGPVQAEIELPAGSVNVAAKETSTVTVSLHSGSKAGEKLIGETEVSFEGGTLAVRVPDRIRLSGNASLDLEIELPEGSRVSASTASADMVLSGELGALDAKTASGEMKAGPVNGDVNLTTASGGIRLEAAAGEVRVETASGDVVIHRADGDIFAKTASGSVTIGQAGQSVTVTSASGDIRLNRIATGLADASSISGDITVAVVPDTGVYLDISTLSGRVSSELHSDIGASPGNGEPDLTVACRSISGNVRLIRATSGDPR
jgi:DUF4097 and DUF4098 domain-containing protein YvlB